MNKNNFLNIFSTFTIKEVRHFDKFLHANYPNAKVLLDIFDYYAKLKTRQKSPPALEVAYNKIFKTPPTQKRSLSKLQNGLSDLYLILKDYLIQKKVLVTQFEKEFLWLNILNERALLHQRDLHLKNLKNKLRLTPIKEVWTPLYQLQLCHFEFFKNDFKKNNIAISQIQDGIDAMDDFYISMQLKYATESLNRARVLSLPTANTPFLSALLEVIKKNPSNFSLQNQLYFYCYIFNQHQDQKHFNQLKKFVIKNEKSLSREERLSTLIYLNNFLAVRLKKGETKWLATTFELYKWGLSNGQKITSRFDYL